MSGQGTKLRLTPVGRHPQQANSGIKAPNRPELAETTSRPISTKSAWPEMRASMGQAGAMPEEAGPLLESMPCAAQRSISVHREKGYSRQDRTIAMSVLRNLWTRRKMAATLQHNLFCRCLLSSCMLVRAVWRAMRRCASQHHLSTVCASNTHTPGGECAPRPKHSHPTGPGQLP